MCVLGRKQCEKNEWRTRRLSNGDAEISHFRGQVGTGLRVPHLGEQLIDIWISLDIERHPEGCLAVTPIDGIHIQHIVYATHLLL